MANILSSLFFYFSLVVAITIHEFSHAFIADYLGDPTPRSRGRLTLNPLKHLDPLGTISLILFNFGWGKPVPIDPYNLQNPKRDEALISLAGPLSNLLVALILSLLIKVTSTNVFLVLFLAVMIRMNIVLAVFNLLPLPPLDGSKILVNLLPQDLSQQLEEAFNSYGVILTLLLLFLPIRGSNLISLIIGPIIQSISTFLTF